MGLGNATNNQVEALLLWEGLKIAISKGLQQLSIVGDSMVIIQRCSKIRQHSNSELSLMFLLTGILLSQLEDYNIFHVKHEINREADNHANRGIALEQGALILDQTNNQICCIP